MGQSGLRTRRAWAGSDRIYTIFHAAGWGSGSSYVCCSSSRCCYCTPDRRDVSAAWAASFHDRSDVVSARTRGLISINHPSEFQKSDGHRRGKIALMVDVPTSRVAEARETVSARPSERVAHGIEPNHSGFSGAKRTYFRLQGELDPLGTDFERRQ